MLQTSAIELTDQAMIQFSDVVLYWLLESSGDAVIFGQLTFLVDNSNYEIFVYGQLFIADDYWK